MLGTHHHRLRWVIATLLAFAVAFVPAISAGLAADRTCIGEVTGYAQTAAHVAAMAAEGVEIGLAGSCQGHCTVLPGAVGVHLPQSGRVAPKWPLETIAPRWLAPVETRPPRV